MTTNFRYIMRDNNFFYPSTALQTSRIQCMNTVESLPFQFDNDDFNTLKNRLGIERLYLPTAKKIAENILIANRLYHWKRKESMISLMGKGTYNFRQSSFVPKSELKD